MYVDLLAEHAAKGESFAPTALDSFVEIGR